MFSHRKARKSILRPAIVKTITVSTLALAALAAVPAVRAQSVCQDIPRDHRILRLGANPISQTPVTSQDDLVSQLDAHRAEFEGLLDAHGLKHLTEALYDTARSGRIEQRSLERGEIFDWMAFRKEGEATTEERLCLASKKTYEAYVLEVTDRQTTPADVTCDISARLSECPDRTITVDASPSTPGVEVVVSGPDGEKPVSGSTVDASTPGSYNFTATAQGTDSVTLVTHTFLIPKICLNLAYAGAGQPRQIEGDTVRRTCEDSVQVDACSPTCSLSVTPASDSCKTFTVNASGHHDALDVVIRNAKGKVVSHLSSFPAPVTVKKEGTYTLEGTATNAAGSSTCQTEAVVDCPKPETGWTLRVFAADLTNDDDPLVQSRLLDTGVSKRSSLRFDGGTGLGLDLEYHLTPRIGLQGSAWTIDLDVSFILDLDNAWERDTDSSSFTALTVGPNFHLTPNAPLDVYVGAFVGMMDFGSSDFTTLGVNTRVPFEDETGFGALVGIDVPFGNGKWGFHAGARYIDIGIDAFDDEEDGEEEREIDVNPLISEVGLFFRF